MKQKTLRLVAEYKKNKLQDMSTDGRFLLFYQTSTPMRTYTIPIDGSAGKANQPPVYDDVLRVVERESGRELKQVPVQFFPEGVQFIPGTQQVFYTEGRYTRYSGEVVEITPLRSTAQDVAKLSQQCEQAETRCQFTLEDQEVMIIFSGGKIGSLECERVPKRTVLAVIIRFGRPKKLQEFKIKNKRSRVFDPSSPPKRGYKTYYYVQDGFMINTYKGQVVGLVYVAAQKDIHLCPEYYEDPKAFVAVGLVP